jgi:hypothetical protein
MSAVQLQDVHGCLLDDRSSVPGRTIYFAFHHSCGLVQGLSNLSPNVNFLFSSQKLSAAGGWFVLVSM